MRTHRFLFLSVVLFLPVLAAAQSLQPGEWRTYTSMRSVTDIAVTADSSHVWVVTTGGAFGLDLRLSGAVATALRTTDGLTENNLTAVAADNSGNIFFGGVSGGFDIYNSSNGHIVKVPDIVNSNFDDKSINSITISGDTAYLATGYGISVFIVSNSSPQKGVFDVTASRIASLPIGDSIRQVIRAGNFVYAAAREGVVWASASSDLHASGNWKLIADSGFAVRALVNFKGTIYAGTGNGLYALSANRDALLPISMPASVAIERMIVSNDSLYLLDRSGTLYSTSDLNHFNSTNINSVAGSIVTAIAYSSHNGIIAGTTATGVTYPLGATVQTNIYPPGPIANEFGVLYFAPTKDELYITNQNLGFGIFHPSDDSWRNFENGSPSLPDSFRGNYWNKVFYDSIRNVTWFTSGAVFKVSGLETSNPVWTEYNTSNGLSNWDGGQDGFIITSGMALDQTGNFLVTDWAASGDGLYRSSDGNAFTPLRLSSSVPNGLPWGCVTQDFDGNYWVGTEEHNEPRSTGVYWHRMSDGAYGHIYGGPGGTLGPAVEGTEVVNAILTDQDGGIWCGTEGGVEIISNPDAIMGSDNPQFSIRTVQFTANQVVRCMTVDGVGNKWVGTDNGIFVVSADGSDSVAHFTAENSPLIADQVISIAIDPARGEAYAATSAGISRFSTIFKQGHLNYDSIRVYPNPVVQTAEVSPTVYIDGLVAGSTVQIFSLGGKLINTIDGSALGSTVSWNGRDAKGHQVPSGLYLVSATSPQSSTTGEAKVVIVRKPSN